MSDCWPLHIAGLALISGFPVLKLVTNGIEPSNQSGGTTPKKIPSSRKRKRSVRAMEDEEMIRKLRDGKPVARNPRQERQLVQLQ